MKHERAQRKASIVAFFKHATLDELRELDTARLRILAARDATADLLVSGLRCAPDCRHTRHEHAAFDRGLLAGERGADELSVPYRSANLREAWLAGQAIGRWNAAHISRQELRSQEAAGVPERP